MSPTVTVFGSAQIQPDDRRYGRARQAGALLAQAGIAVCTGGYQGLMGAVSQGAYEQGGKTIGVTMSTWTRQVNPYIRTELAMPDFIARMRRMIDLGDGYLVLDGGMGTLAELSLTWSLLQIKAIPLKPCVLLGDNWDHLLQTFQNDLVIRAGDYSLLTLAATPAEAVQHLSRQLLS